MIQLFVYNNLAIPMT